MLQSYLKNVHQTTMKKMRYIGNTLDLAKLKEFAKILS